MENRTRNQRFLVSLTEKEMSSLMKNVKKTGLTRDAYIRKLIAGIQPKERPSADCFEVLKVLRQISINMNQIALKANTLNLIDAPFYSDCHRKLQAAIGKIMRTVYG